MSLGWRTTRFEDLVEFHDSRRVPLSKRERETRRGPFPYYGAQGVIDWLDDYIFEGRFLLIAEDGENLNSRKQPVAQIAEGKFWVNNHAHVVRALEDIADDDFLRVALEFHPLNGLVTGAAQPKLSQANLKRLELSVPDFVTQRAIGDAIRAADGFLDVCSRRIEILEQMARLVYQEWFERVRFPGHDRAEFVESEHGRIPSDWKCCQLGDILELAYGKALRAGDRRGGNVPVYGSAGVAGGHDEALVDGPGVIVGRKGNVGALYWADGSFFPIDTTYYVRTSVPLVYAFQLLQTLEFIDSHAAVPGLSRDQAYRLPVLKPSEEILDEFERSIAPMYDLRANLIKQREVVRNIRDLVLPRLVFGEVDFSQAATMTEPVA